MIRQTGIPAIFTDFCEEAAHLASCCISSITGQPLKIPVCVRLCHCCFFSIVAIEQTNESSWSIMPFPDPGKSFQAASCSGKQCIIRTMLFKLLCFWDVKLPCHQEVYLEIDLSRNGMWIFKEDKGAIPRTSEMGGFYFWEMMELGFNVGTLRIWEDKLHKSRGTLEGLGIACVQAD
jgi:hypothetical protein